MLENELVGTFGIGIENVGVCVTAMKLVGDVLLVGRLDSSHLRVKVAVHW